MPTFRPELSTKNKYWLPKHRTLELKHFCLQYPDWVKACNSIRLYPLGCNISPTYKQQVEDFTAKQAMRLKYYNDKIKLVQTAAEDTDEDLSSYILRAVTEDRSYNNLKLEFGIPCCKDVFHTLKRRFYYILNEYRD